MSEQKHTPEPWEAHKTRVYFPNLAGGFDLRDCPHPEENARRIVACVNACAGIPTEALEEHGKNSDASLALIDSYARQRDELLAALKDCVEALDHCERSLYMRVNPPTLINARAAIAKVKP